MKWNINNNESEGDTTGGSYQSPDQSQFQRDKELQRKWKLRQFGENKNMVRLDNGKYINTRLNPELLGEKKRSFIGRFLRGLYLGRRRQKELQYRAIEKLNRAIKDENDVQLL